MEVVALGLPEVKLVTPRRFHDNRGYFYEAWSAKAFAGAGLDFDFVQDNVSLSLRRGTVRGLHFQLAPNAQAKLVSCLRGAILDVAVDIRAGSPTFGRHVAAELSGENGRALMVPAGFAHGFVTLVDDTIATYKVDAPYSQPDDRGIYWADPALGIDWPITEAEAEMSDKDKILPRLADLPVCFTYGA